MFQGVTHSDESEFKLPEDVIIFIQNYEKSIKDGDVEKIMHHYSDSFNSNGRDKKATEVFWASMLSRVSVTEFRIVPMYFEKVGDKAKFEGTVIFNARQSPLQIKTIIKEGEQWKWYGKPIMTSGVAKLRLSFNDNEWDGEKVPDGQQCLRFGGKPFTPSIRVEGIPDDADAIIMEFSDRSWPPMDNGGHGRIGYAIPPSVSDVIIPKVPGHTFSLPDNFFVIEPHRGSHWDKSGAYMPPCSGGKGNHYYVKVLAVKIANGNIMDYKILSKGVLKMGKY
jgi:hypothetical protein